MDSAIANVEEGGPIRIAAWYHDIPSTSLKYHVYGTTIETTIQKKRGKMGVLSHEEDDELVAYFIKMQNYRVAVRKV